jgi:ACS family glucarate transporter-like MFS transporter
MPTRAGGLRWSLVIFLIAHITFVMSLDRTAIAVAAPTIQHEYGFSLFEMSLILTSFSWTYALLQVPGGWLAERYGPRRTLFWANTLWSVLTAATPLGFNLGSFMGLRALLGVGQAADWPSTIVAIRRWFPLSERGKGNSVLLGGLYLGPIAAAPITTWVMLSFGWRWAFYAYGLLGIGLGFDWWACFRDLQAEHNRIAPCDGSDSCDDSARTLALTCAIAGNVSAGRNLCGYLIASDGTASRGVLSVSKR